MYRVYDKSAAIKQIQKYLKYIYPENSLNQSGIYDEATRKMIEKFQADNNIQPSGNVDYITHKMLYEEFNKTKDKNLIKSSVGYFIDFPLSPGDYADEMLQIHKIMANILNYYGYHHRLRESKFYSNESSRAVKAIRRIYLMDDKDIIDEELFGKMILNYNELKGL